MDGTEVSRLLRKWLDFYHSLYFPYFDESGNEAFNSSAEEESSKLLTMETLDSAIADAREWVAERERFTSKDTREKLQSYFNLS